MTAALKTLDWYRKCKRCHSREALEEVAHPCGCVNLFCASCREGRREREHEDWATYQDWVEGYSEQHKRLGGRCGELPCPVRWDDPRWTIMIGTPLPEEQP